VEAKQYKAIIIDLHLNNLYFSNVKQGWQVTCWFSACVCSRKQLSEIHGTGGKWRSSHQANSGKVLKYW